MLFNGNFPRYENYNQIENQICLNSMKNVINYDLYSKKEIKESLNKIENISTQFSLWLSDLETKIQDAMSTREREIRLDTFNFKNSNNILLKNIFNNFEKLKIREESQSHIEEEIQKFIKENKRTKRRKNYSLFDEGIFIKKKEKKEKIHKQTENEKENQLNILNVKDKEIQSRSDSENEIKSREEKSLTNKILIKTENNLTESNSDNQNLFDTKYNPHFHLNTHNGLKDIIEEMPSKEEENFKFSLSILDKKDSNVEMKEKNEDSHHSNKNNIVDANNIQENPFESDEHIINFNLKGLSAVKSDEEKNSQSISTLKNFNINDIIANLYDSNGNILEEQKKIQDEIERQADENVGNIEVINVNITSEIIKDKCDEHDDIVIKDNIIREAIQDKPISDNQDKVINPLNNTHESKEKKFIFKSSNIKMNLTNKTAKTLNQQDDKINPTHEIPLSNPHNGNINFTFFKEKPIINTANDKNKNKDYTTTNTNKPQVNQLNINNPMTNTDLFTVDSHNTITNTNTLAQNSNNNLNSNFLKDKDNLFNILFNYNESFSNLEESPAIEKWNPNKLDSSSKKGINLKNNFSQNHNQFHESNNKHKLPFNKTFKEKENYPNFYKSNKQHKQIVPIFQNNMPTSQDVLNSNKFSKSKNVINYSQNFDSENVLHIKNNITKTLTKKIMDPGYEMTDNSCSSSDNKKDSDSDDKLYGTPIFKNLKVPKFIPKWANDKKYINERVAYQKSHMHYKNIFGACKIDNLNLNLIFTNTKKEYNQPRGDSADWKLDNTISSHCEDRNNDGGINCNNYNFNNSLSNNKNICGANRKLLEVFNENNY